MCCLSDCTCTCIMSKGRVAFHGLSPTLGMNRMRMTETQKQVIMERLNDKDYLTRKEKCQLANSLNIPRRKIEIWLHNMRSKKRAKGMSIKGEQNSVCLSQCTIHEYTKLLFTFILSTIIHTCMQCIVHWDYSATWALPPPVYMNRKILITGRWWKR